MSIYKIIERIRMIEENDFSKKESIIVEDIKGTPDELNTLFTKADNKAIKAVSLGHDSINKADRLYNKWMGSVTVNSDGGSDESYVVSKGALPENLPNKDESNVFKIYNELKNRNILPKDLNSNNFKPKYGYFRSKSNDNLILLNGKLILLNYSDDKLTTLLGMKINKGKNLSTNDFIDLYDEFDKNKSKYKINKVSILNKNSIDIKF